MNPHYGRDTMNKEDVLADLAGYQKTLLAMLTRCTRAMDGLVISSGDKLEYNQIVQELVDLFNDFFGQDNRLSRQIADYVNSGKSSFLQVPTYASMQDVLSTVRAATTKVERSEEVSGSSSASKDVPQNQNVFIIHGQDEAKRRELKEIIRDKFKLNPLVLADLPSMGCSTVIEKFEHYAPQCSYAIALFTPDDEVKGDDGPYLQARPNSIYELGWFCGRLGRDRVILLLKEGTTLFSDFGGIVEIRFSRDISEKIEDIREELLEAKMLTQEVT